MQIALVGSYSVKRWDETRFWLLRPFFRDHRWPLRGSAKSFEQACTSLGRELARAGHQLFVQSDRPDTADRHVVNGYLEIAGTGSASSHRIVIWRPTRSDKLVFDSEINRYPTLFAYENTEAGKWDSARFNMCHAAQATIVVAGQARSETTGYTVMSAGRLLIPISSFGGAADTLLSRLEQQFLNARRLPEPLTIDDLKQPWSDKLLQRVCSCLEAPQLTIVIIHGRDHTPVEELTSLIANGGFGQPIVMQSEFKPGETLPEKWERIAGGDNTVAIGLCTADDVGRYRSDTDLFTRTRQNVWLEVGWFWGKYQHRGRLLLLPQRRDDKRLEMPSDLDGLETFEWQSSPLERGDEIRRFLETFRH